MHYYPSQGAKVCSLLFNTLRRWARQLKLANAIRIVRQLIHFGPWRHLFINAIRFFRGPAEWRVNAASLMPDLDIKTISATLRQDGVCVAGVLPAPFVDALCRFTDQLPAQEYHQTHQANEKIARIADDPALLNVVGEYLGCEPVLVESSLFVTNPEASKTKGAQNHFHFDYAGWQSLNVFVYLTDVSLNSSHHVAIKGSHKKMRLSTLLKGLISDKEAENEHGHAINAITGPAGTVFFENVEVLHKRTQGHERRVLLNLTYTSHRNLMSYGRANPRQLAFRDSQFARAQSASQSIPGSDK
ncbi:phytanoyl-CoA dioxygenase family protein [Salinimonas chungwhensis]|uniref:phytanoyl-CoA dioxygenase family protein n=1 Tax=Salinimonas chungwhensis TaxID=265425 RepID=UPI000375C9CA|nr:phytanoyl-CoA dioxygenase family protein [Salinimonas chungwhensis]